MIERNYPVVNDWRKGCSVWRPTGKADHDYVYEREFIRGVADKTNGVLRYTLTELGGPGWVVAKDRQGTRSLLELRELTYTDHGEIPAADVLEVVRSGLPGEAGAWDGTLCPDHHRAIIESNDAAEVVICPDCALEDERQERVAAYAATAPDTEPF